MTATAQLTIGPVLFHWPEDMWRDFYFRIADEAPIGTVYVGEVVCGKRAPFYEKLYDTVSERLRRGGKAVVFSTLAEVMIKHDRRIVEGLCALEDILIEANDASALWRLSGRPHTIGPFINAYSEDTLAHLAANGAHHVCLPPELPARSIAVMAEKAKSLGVTVEVQVYGRVSLALSARCYHARAHDRVKDNCQFVCGEDADGMNLKTLDGTPFLTVNGIQTLSHTCLNLAADMKEMRAMGVTHFRLSPHSHDMVATATLFRAVIDGKMEPEAASDKLSKTGLTAPFSDGFYHRREGYKFFGRAQEDAA